MNCKCGGKIVTNDPKKIKYLKCKTCEAIVFKEAYGAKFSNKELAEIISGCEIYKMLKNAKGKEYGAWVNYDFSKKKLNIDFNKPGPIVFDCVCGGAVRDCGILYKCDECESKMMKTIAKLPINKTDAEKIFSGERVYFDDFTSKEGEAFSAYIALKKGKWTAFEFDKEVEELEDDEVKEDLFLNGKENKNMDQNIDVDALNDLFFNQEKEYEDEE